MMFKNEDRIETHFVVVGGGIAGVTCAEQLAINCPDHNVLLISASSLIKAVTNVKQTTRMLEEFDIEERSHVTLESQYKNVKVHIALVVGLNAKNHEVMLSTGHIVSYKKICLCAGAVPKVIAPDSPYVLGIRDTETIQAFQKRLANANRILVVGNGGIATELVYEIVNCQVIWAMKDQSVGATFFDAGAAEFFVPHIKEEKQKASSIHKRMKYMIEEFQSAGSKSIGSALGPDWCTGISMTGVNERLRNVNLQFNCEVRSIYTQEEFVQKNLKTTELKDTPSIKDEWPVYVELTNDCLFGCDFIVSATGVTPNTKPFLTGDNEFAVADDGGLKVNDQMQTSEPDVYAAGDMCTASWDLAKHWFQMRLWTQAKQMGVYAARCIVAHENDENCVLDICFDIFTHVTRFFGYKVILLGLYNGQKLGSNCELLLRVTKGQEYVKVVLQDGYMQGAILIGETDLEETFENLILNQLDLSRYGEDLLDPGIDIEDYFD